MNLVIRVLRLEYKQSSTRRTATNMRFHLHLAHPEDKLPLAGMVLAKTLNSGFSFHLMQQRSLFHRRLFD